MPNVVNVRSDKISPGNPLRKRKRHSGRADTGSSPFPVVETTNMMYDSLIRSVCGVVRNKRTCEHDTYAIIIV